MDLINSDLANTYGNLLNRCTSFKLNPDQIFPGFDLEIFDSRSRDIDKEMWMNLRKLSTIVAGHYDDFNIYKALEVIMTQLHLANGFLHFHKPWELVKDPAEKEWLYTVLHVTMETLRVCSMLLQPVIPTLADTVLSRLSIPMAERKLVDIETTPKGAKLGPDCGPLLPRIQL